MTKARSLTGTAGCLVALTIFAVHAWGQAYPTKPIQIIVPFAAGGSADFVGRLVGTRLSEEFGQPVVINVRDGGGGIVGTQRTAQATPDGYTLQIGNNSTHGVNQVFNSKLPYDTLKDFTPVTILVTSQQVLLTGSAVPAKAVKEFITLAKARPGQFNFGSGGAGSQTHLAGELFKYVTGTNVVHIPYKGTALAINALIGGEVHVLFSGIVGAMPHLQSGRLKALGITGVTRSALLSEVATLGEQGVSSFETGQNYMLLGPRGIPRPIVLRLHQAMVKIANSADFKQRLASTGGEPVASTPEACTASIRNELAMWTKFAKETGIRIE